MDIEAVMPLAESRPEYRPPTNKSRTDDEEHVLTLLPKDRQHARTLRQVAEALQLDEAAAERALGKLIATGEADIDRDTNPHTFWRVVAKPVLEEVAQPAGHKPTDNRGYRNLSPAEVALVNEVKAHARATQALFERVFAIATADGQQQNGEPARWASIARTSLQTGYMQLIRAITRPEGF